MQLIVPLQGVVQGRGSIFLGTLIPCALFYFFQLYLKRNRSTSSSPSTSPSPSPPGSASDGEPIEHGHGDIPRTASRNLLLALRGGGSSGVAAVSARAAAIVNPRGSPYSVGIKKCKEDPYHPTENPDGVIQLGLAENQLSLDLLQEWVTSKWKDLAQEEQHLELNINGLAAYQPFDGLMELKMAVAELMGQVVHGTISFDPSLIVLTAGATPAIETLMFCLADSGNAILVPSPYSPGYDANIKWRTGIELIPVPCRSTDNFRLNIPAIERAYNQAKKRGLKVRAVLFSNPSNPVGHLLHREKLLELVDFATKKNIHLISDEAFAGSTHGNEEFVSVAEVIDTGDFDTSRVHIVYSLSKDLSLPGFRVGVIYSSNKHVLAAASKLARFSSVSVPTQRLLISMLTGTSFITKYININRERLRRMYGLFVDGLKQVGIECIKSNGGFYCWADLSKYMKSYSEKGELELWNNMLNFAKIHSTAGAAFHSIEPGWFRFCFTMLTEKDIPIVMERIKRMIDSH